LKKSFLAIGLILISVVFMSGCGGNNNFVIKQQFEAKPKVAVYYFKRDITGNLNLRTIDDWKAPVPQEYEKITGVVVDVLAKEWDNPKIEVVNNYKPKGYDLIIYVSVAGSYGLEGDKSPYKSKLSFYTTLQIFDKNWKTLTSLFGKNIASVNSSEIIAESFSESIAQIPATSLVNKLMDDTRNGVKSYVAELKAAKPKK
jgi:hypothetical protein